MQPRPSIRPYMQFLFVQSGFPLELPFPRFVTSPQLFFRSGIPHHRGSARTFTAVRISRRSYTNAARYAPGIARCLSHKCRQTSYVMLAEDTRRRLSKDVLLKSLHQPCYMPNKVQSHATVGVYALMPDHSIFRAMRTVKTGRFQLQGNEILMLDIFF